MKRFLKNNDIREKIPKKIVNGIFQRHVKFVFNSPPPLLRADFEKWFSLILKMPLISERVVKRFKYLLVKRNFFVEWGGYLKPGYQVFPVLSFDSF